MRIRSIILGLLLFLSSPIMAEPDAAVKPMEAQGVIDSINLESGYITVYDIPLGVDRITRVYDQKGGILSKKALKLGQKVQFIARLPKPNSAGDIGRRITFLKSITVLK